MKFCLMLFITVVPIFAMAAWTWEPKIRLKVVDEDACPVSDVNCDIDFVKTMSIPRQVKTISGPTDQNGYFSASGTTLEPPMCTIAEDNTNMYSSSVLAKVGKEDYTVVLRKRGNPISLIKNAGALCEFPYPKESVEYDCFRCDFLPPYGKGRVADIKIVLKGGVRDLPDDDALEASYWYDVTLSFCVPGGGFVIKDTTPESEYRYTRIANPEWKWQSSIHFWKKGFSSPIQGTDYQYTKDHMVFKVVRKVAGRDCTYYGILKDLFVKIGIPDKSRHISLATMINPNPDDPNIEFDGHALKPQDPKAPVAKAGEK